MAKTFYYFVFLALFSVSHSFGGGLPEKKSYDYREQTLISEIKKLEKNLESSPEECIQILDSKIKYAIENNFREALIQGYFLMGKSYVELKQPKLALHFLKLVHNEYVNPNTLSKTEKAIPKVAIPADYYFAMGDIYSMLEEYEQSIQNYEISIKETASEELKYTARFSIAQNFYAQEKFKEAIKLFQELLQDVKNSNAEKVSEIYTYLAACHISIGKPETGLEYYNLSVNYLKGEKSDDVRSDYQIISKALKTQKNPKIEFGYLNTSLEVSKESIQYLRLAQAYFDKKNYSDAENSIDDYLANISYNIIDISEILILKQMALRLQSTGNNKKAMNYLLRYEELNDSIASKIKYLQQKTQEIGARGYENILQLEILQKDKEISENAITHLVSQQELAESSMILQKYVIYLLSLLFVLSAIAIIYILKISKQRRVANQQLALRSLRSQMNPHFIFNALNSVNSFISVSDERSANKFLSEFSRLMRTVMENSEYNFIPLSKELEIIRIYLELEHFRFSNKFDYELNIDSNLDEESYALPPMLIQPYIENAIWHGLRYKEEKGFLKIDIAHFNQSLKVVIQDNGIGRKKSAEIKTKNQKKTKSTALRNINERLKIIEELHHIKLSVSISDLNMDGSGTLVTLLIPQKNEQ
jgi:tetratricopeptide (TPR) repeat protein